MTHQADLLDGDRLRGLKIVEAPVILIDCQTSGASPKNSHLLEIAWTVISGASEASVASRDHSSDSYSAVVRLPDGAKLTSRISNITGLSEDDMATAVPPELVAKKLKNAIESIRHAGGYAVIHFARFEKTYLDRLWTDVFALAEFELPVVCTHQLSRRLFPEFPGYGLRAVSGFFGKTMVDHKRAQSHVAATEAVWAGVLAALASKGIETVSEMNELLTRKESRPIVAREYRIPREKRLGLPNKPGVYKYIGKSGAVLYVGKATSLKTRVNSYFRRQRGGDPRKNEMLMQAWDIEVEATATPLESALREFNLIQELSPPYNMALRRRPGELIYLERDGSVAGGARDSKLIGPVDDRYGLRELMALIDWTRNRADAASILDKNAIPSELRNVFYGLEDSDLLWNGYSDFCADIGLEADKTINLRALLQIGLRLLSEKWARVKADAEAGLLFKKQPVAEEPEVDAAEAEAGGDLEGESEPEEEHVWTREEIAAKIPRLLRRAALAWVETLWLRRLTSFEVKFRPKTSTKWRVLLFKNGEIVDDLSKGEGAVSVEWTALGLARFRTVVQELRRVLARGGEVELTPQFGPEKSHSSLAALLAIGF